MLHKYIRNLLKHFFSGTVIFFVGYYCHIGPILGPRNYQPSQFSPFKCIAFIFIASSIPRNLCDFGLCLPVFQWLSSKLVELCVFSSNFMQQSVSWYDDSRSAFQVIPPPPCYGTRRLITAFTRAYHWTLFWAKWIQFTFSHTKYSRSFLIMSSCLSPDLSAGVRAKIRYEFLVSLMRATCPANFKPVNFITLNIFGEEHLPIIKLILV
jgi:hypothetical protein